MISPGGPEPRLVDELKNSGPFGLLGLVIVRGAQVVGIWSRKIEREVVRISTRLFEGVDGGALPDALQRFSEFVDRPPAE